MLYYPSKREEKIAGRMREKIIVCCKLLFAQSFYLYTLFMMRKQEQQTHSPLPQPLTQVEKQTVKINFTPSPWLIAQHNIYLLPCQIIVIITLVNVDCKESRIYKTFHSVSTISLLFFAHVESQHQHQAASPHNFYFSLSLATWSSGKQIKCLCASCSKLDFMTQVMILRKKKTLSRETDDK